MKHHDTKRKFNRSKNERNALMYALTRNLIVKERITTTEAKAKELRPNIEKLITRAKNDTIANRRFVSAKLRNHKKETSKLFEKIAPKYKDREGGYTRILKLEPRKSDGAKLALIEFV